MKISLFLLTLTCFGLTGTVYGQGRIVMLNGNEKRFSSAEIKGDVIVYQPEKGKTNLTKKLDIFDVFAIVRDKEGEQVVYKPDTVSGEDPSVDEVRDYIVGEKYASNVYRKPLNLISGIAAGGVGSMIGYYGLIVPIVYPAVLGRFSPKLKQPLTLNYDAISGKFSPIDSSVSKPNIVVTEAFTAGYVKKARGMKIKNSLIGGGIGFAVGITILALVFDED